MYIVRIDLCVYLVDAFFFFSEYTNSVCIEHNCKILAMYLHTYSGTTRVDQMIKYNGYERVCTYLGVYIKY